MTHADGEPLGERAKVAYTLRQFGMSHKEIGIAMGISDGTSRSYCSFAKLKGYMIPEEHYHMTVTEILNLYCTEKGKVTPYLTQRTMLRLNDLANKNGMAVNALVESILNLVANRPALNEIVNNLIESERNDQ